MKCNPCVFRLVSHPTTLDGLRTRSDRTMRTSWALAALSLSMLLSSLGAGIANVALPAISQAFDAPFGQIQWVVSGYLLAMTAAVVGAGRLGDRLGRRRLLLVGVTLFSVASLLCAVAPTLPLLVAARALQGIGAAFMTALAMALVGDTVAGARTGSALGLLGTMSAVGTALGPSLGGVLIASGGWRAPFLAVVPLALLALGFAYRHVPAPAGVTRSPTAAARGRGAKHSISIALWRGLAMTTLVSTVVMSTLVVGPFYLSTVLSLDIASIGLILSAGPIVAALSGVPAGRAVDRFGTQRTIVAGLAAMVLGCVALAALPMAGIASYVSAIAVLTSGYALFQAGNNTSIMRAIEPARRGVVSGQLSLARNLGLVAGASLMGGLFAATGMRSTFAVAAVLVLGALAIAKPRMSPEPVRTRSSPPSRTSPSTPRA